MIPLRKHPIFYKRDHFMNLVDKYGESKVVRDHIMFGEELLYKVHGYMYRVKGYRKQKDVIDFLSHCYGRRGFNLMLDMEFRQHLKEIKLLINTYEE